MNIRSSTLLRAFLLLACMTPAAHAQGWLGGASVGQAKQHSYEVGGPIATSNSNDTSARIFGGYKFQDWFGTVVSYVDLGTPKYDGPAWGGFTDSLKASAIDVSMVMGFQPGDQKIVSPFLMLGVFRFTQDVHYRDASGRYDYQDSGTRISYGTGVQFKVGNAWAMHIGWQHFTKVGDKNNSGHEYDRDIIETGFEYQVGR